MILLIDLGSHTTHLIGRRLKEFGIQSTVVDPTNVQIVLADLGSEIAGLIITSGPAKVLSDQGVLSVFEKLLKNNSTPPVLAIGTGWLVVAKALGGRITEGQKEFGERQLAISAADPLFDQITHQSTTVWLSSEMVVETLPAGFQNLASTADVKYAVAKKSDGGVRSQGSGAKGVAIIGLQFQPEVSHTKDGQLLLKNFVKHYCKLKIKKYKLDVDDLIISTREKINDISKTSRAISAVSGGVDSRR